MSAVCLHFQVLTVAFGCRAKPSEPAECEELTMPRPAVAIATQQTSQDTE